MSSQYPNAYSQKFESDVHLQYAQRGPRLKGKVQERSMVGAESIWLPQIGAQTSTNSYERHAETQYSDTIHTTRKLTSNAETQADLIDISDQRRSVAQFLGPYAENFSQLFGRRYDTIVLEAAVGTNYYKVTGDTAETSIALPGTQQVAAAFGGGGSIGLTLPKMVEMKSILGRNETPMGEALIFVHRQVQLDNLLNTVTQVSDADFANVKALVNGDVNYFMGFEFVKTQLCAITAGDIASCVAYTKSALVAGVTSGFTAKVEQLPTKNYSWQVWASLDMGATRMQEEGVVEVLCDETP
jgi:hypothetical protein